MGTRICATLARGRCAVLVLLVIAAVAHASAGDGLRFLVMPGPNARTSLTGLYRVASVLVGRGHQVLLATSNTDEALLQSLAGQHDGPPVEVALYEPYAGGSTLTRPLSEASLFKKKGPAPPPKLPAPISGDDVTVWTHNVRLWYAANCEPVMGRDAAWWAVVQAFAPTHVLGESAFVCFSHVADRLGGVPRMAVSTTLMPPLEQVLFGMTEGIFEIPTARSGLPRHMGISHLLANLQAHWSLTGGLKRSFRQLDDMARSQWGITEGAMGGVGNKTGGVLAALKGVQALVVAADPLLSALPSQLPPHVHLVGPLTQPTGVPLPLPPAPRAAPPSSSPGRVILALDSWSAGVGPLQALLLALQPLVHGQGSMLQLQVAGPLPSEAVLSKLGSQAGPLLLAAHQASNTGTVGARAGSTEGVPLADLLMGSSSSDGVAAVVVADAHPASGLLAAWAGVPLLAFPAAGDQVDQAARLQEAGMATLLPRTPQGHTQVSGAQQDVGRIRAAVQDLAGNATKQAAARAVAAALRARRTHPMHAAADVIERVALRHGALKQLSSLTGQPLNQLLQRPGHADGGNLMITSAFAVGFVIMLLATALTHTSSKLGAGAGKQAAGVGQQGDVAEQSAGGAQGAGKVQAASPSVAALRRR